MLNTFIPKAIAGGAVVTPTTPVDQADQGFSVLPRFGELADKIRSGNIQLNDIPDFIASFIEAAILFAGVVAFLMILIGGYQYIIGGVYSDMREQGKSTLTYAIAGFILSMLSYAIVTIVQLAATSFT